MSALPALNSTITSPCAKKNIINFDYTLINLIMLEQALFKELLVNIRHWKSIFITPVILYLGLIDWYSLGRRVKYMVPPVKLKLLGSTIKSIFTKRLSNDEQGLGTYKECTKHPLSIYKLKCNACFIPDTIYYCLHIVFKNKNPPPSSLSTSTKESSNLLRPIPAESNLSFGLRASTIPCPLLKSILCSIIRLN